MQIPGALNPLVTQFQGLPQYPQGQPMPAQAPDAIQQQGQPHHPVEHQPPLTSQLDPMGQVLLTFRPPSQYEFD